MSSYALVSYSSSVFHGIPVAVEPQSQFLFPLLYFFLPLSAIAGYVGHGKVRDTGEEGGSIKEIGGSHVETSRFSGVIYRSHAQPTRPLAPEPPSRLQISRGGKTEESVAVLARDICILAVWHVL